MRKPLSFPHLPFALNTTHHRHAARSANILAANGRWREDEDLLRARRRRCACAPLIGIRFADGLSAGGYEGVRSADERKRGAFAQRKSQEGARYNSAASRDREEPPLIHRSSQSPISKGEHGAPACAPYGFSLRSKVPSESFAFCGASQQHPPRYEQSRQEMKNNKIVVISVIQNIMWVDMIQKINRFS